MKVVISNQSLNSYGSRIMTAGIDIKQYEKNPIVLWMHIRPVTGSKEEPLPIGRMENIRVEGENLVGDIVFDEKDDFARKIKGKYEDGFLNMVSAGLDIVELSEDEQYLLPGQTRMTVVKSKLREVSCVDIGANDDSLVDTTLYYKEQVIDMNKNEQANEVIPLLKNRLDNNNKKMKKMNEILKALNLKEGATEEMAVEAINSLKEKAARGEEVEKLFNQEKKKRIELMVSKAVEEKKIDADKKDQFINIGKTSGEEALAMCLSQMQPRVLEDVQQAIEDKKAKSKIELTAETWDKLDKEGKLYDLKKNDSQTYEKLFEAKFRK